MPFVQIIWQIIGIIITILLDSKLKNLKNSDFPQTFQIISSKWQKSKDW